MSLDLSSDDINRIHLFTMVLIIYLLVLLLLMIHGKCSRFRRRQSEMLAESDALYQEYVSRVDAASTDAERESILDESAAETDRFLSEVESMRWWRF